MFAALSRFVNRFGWYVIAAWVLLVVVVGAAAVGLGFAATLGLTVIAYQHIGASRG